MSTIVEESQDRPWQEVTEGPGRYELQFVAGDVIEGSRKVRIQMGRGNSFYGPLTKVRRLDADGNLFELEVVDLEFEQTIEVAWFDPIKRKGMARVNRGVRHIPQSLGYALTEIELVKVVLSFLMDCAMAPYDQIVLWNLRKVRGIYDPKEQYCQCKEVELRSERRIEESNVDPTFDRVWEKVHYLVENDEPFLIHWHNYFDHERLVRWEIVPAT